MTLECNTQRAWPADTSVSVDWYNSIPITLMRTALHHLFSLGKQYLQMFRQRVRILLIRYSCHSTVLTSTLLDVVFNISPSIWHHIDLKRTISIAKLHGVNNVLCQAHNVTFQMPMTRSTGRRISCTLQYPALPRLRNLIPHHENSTAALQ